MNKINLIIKQIIIVNNKTLLIINEIKQIIVNNKTNLITNQIKQIINKIMKDFISLI